MSRYLSGQLDRFLLGLGQRLEGKQVEFLIGCCVWMSSLLLQCYFCFSTFLIDWRRNLIGLSIQEKLKWRQTRRDAFQHKILRFTMAASIITTSSLGILLD